MLMGFSWRWWRWHRCGECFWLVPHRYLIERIFGGDGFWFMTRKKMTLRERRGGMDELEVEGKQRLVICGEDKRRFRWGLIDITLEQETILMWKHLTFREMRFVDEGASEQTNKNQSKTVIFQNGAIVQLPPPLPSSPPQQHPFSSYWRYRRHQWCSLKQIFPTRIHIAPQEKLISTKQTVK